MYSRAILRESTSSSQSTSLSASSSQSINSTYTPSSRQHSSALEDRYKSTLESHPEKKENQSSSSFFGNLGKIIMGILDPQKKASIDPFNKELRVIETSFGMVHEQKTDGNCVYRSIGKGMTTIEPELKRKGTWDLSEIEEKERHVFLRAKTVSWMREVHNYTDDTFESFLTATIQDATPAFKDFLKSEIKRLPESIQISQFVEKNGIDDAQKEQAKRLTPILQSQLLQYKDLYKSLSNQLMTPEQYFEQAVRDKFYAGLIEIYSLCQIYGFDVIIHQVDQGHHENKEQLTISGSSAEEERPVIHLEFIGGNHYNTVLPKD